MEITSTAARRTRLRFHIQQIIKHKVRFKYLQAIGFLAFGDARDVTGIDFKECLRQSGSKLYDCANVIAPHTVGVNYRKVSVLDVVYCSYP